MGRVVFIVAFGVCAFAQTQAAAQCLGAGVNHGGANNGWTLAPCSSGRNSGALLNGAGQILNGLGSIGQGGGQDDTGGVSSYDADRTAMYNLARQRFEFAQSEFRSGHFDNARLYFGVSADHFRSIGDDADADSAEHNKRLSACRNAIEEIGDLNPDPSTYIPSMSESFAEQTCAGLPEADWLRRRKENLIEQRRTADAFAAARRTMESIRADADRAVREDAARAAKEGAARVAREEEAARVAGEEEAARVAREEEARAAKEEARRAEERDDALRRAAPQLPTDNPFSRDAVATLETPALPADNPFSTQAPTPDAPSLPADNPFAAPAQAQHPSISGASEPQSNLAKSLPTPHKLWTGQKEDCGSASGLEKQTAAWFYMCGSSPASSNAYEPPIKPKDLFKDALERCGSNDPTCVESMKLKIILSSVDWIANLCRTRTSDALLRCVDDAYIYGPDGESREHLRERLRGLLASSSDPSDAGEVPASRDDTKSTQCPPGTGLKYDQSGFGRHTCQSLINSDVPLPADRSSPEAVVETEIDDVAQGAVAQAVTRAPAQDRAACERQAFASARSLMKGGAPVVDQDCDPLAKAARDGLIDYAGAHVKRLSPGLENLLSGLARAAASSSARKS